MTYTVKFKGCKPKNITTMDNKVVFNDETIKTIKDLAELLELDIKDLSIIKNGKVADEDDRIMDGDTILFSIILFGG